MPPKPSRITDSYKTKKNANRNSSALKKDSAKPSTSNADFEADMKILKDFDLNWEYGPSTGITRMERWNRAEKNGLNPSGEVKQIIECHTDDDRYTKSLWNDYKNII